MSIFRRGRRRRVRFDAAGNTRKNSQQDARAQEALRYHEHPTPGKVGIALTRSVADDAELALAYTPGVAVPCLEIEKDPSAAYRYTNRSNLVAVISNGTAVLGLGNIGALASKPVMEGKAALFKKLGGVDAFDIEINENSPEELASLIIRLAPTFGGVNLEDIKAPDCFVVERLCREQMDIPVFHDDQHGTAVCVAAALQNACLSTDKPLKKVKLVCLGAGASAIASVDLLQAMGLNQKNVLMYDSKGLLHRKRRDLNAEKQRYAHPARDIKLADAFKGADIFLGLSGPNSVEPAWVKTMAPRPIILALANPTPEIMPERVQEVRDDAIIATGRSDYPNQVNNVLCFPYMFRGALDVQAREINKDMLVAAANAIAKIGRDSSAELLPTVWNPQLIEEVPKAVAEAAIKSGVARAPFQPRSL